MRRRPPPFPTRPGGIRQRPDLQQADHCETAAIGISRRTRGHRLPGEGIGWARLARPSLDHTAAGFVEYTPLHLRPRHAGRVAATCLPSPEGAPLHLVGGIPMLVHETPFRVTNPGAIRRLGAEGSLGPCEQPIGAGRHVTSRFVPLRRQTREMRHATMEKRTADRAGVGGLPEGRRADRAMAGRSRPDVCPARRRSAEEHREAPGDAGVPCPAHSGTGTGTSDVAQRCAHVPVSSAAQTNTAGVDVPSSTRASSAAADAAEPPATAAVVPSASIAAATASTTASTSARTAIFAVKRGPIGWLARGQSGPPGERADGTGSYLAHPTE